MYPSIQAKIWGNIGQVSDLLDMVLDSFIKVVAQCLSQCSDVVASIARSFETNQRQLHYSYILTVRHLVLFL